MSNIVKAASLAAVIISAAGTFWMTDPSFAQGNNAQDSSNVPVVLIQNENISSTVAVPVAGEAQDSANTAAVAQVESPVETAIITDESGKSNKADAKDMAAIEKEAEAIIEKMEAPKKASSLAALVDATPHLTNLTAEQRCLAGAIYFESKSESLAGQLAVGRVVINRAKSGRFPNSLCGVVYQKSQFSFVRGRSMPKINTGGKQWKNAVAIAQIAMNNSWESKVEGALFFHAKYVSPGWKLRRMASVDNHIFYR